jgi:membrane protease YdiL (CAAX protease family)
VTAAAVTVAGLGAYNLLLHRLIPRRWHLPTNLIAAAGLMGAGRAAGLDLGRGRTGDGIRVGLAAAATVGGTVAVAAAVPPVRPLFADERVRADSRREVAYESLARIPVGTAVFEEVAFRGVLTGLLARTTGETRAVGLSSLLFGLWHLVPALDNHAGSGTAGRMARFPSAVATIGVTAAAGLAFDRLRRRSGSLLAPILAHAALNSAAYLAAQVALGPDQSTAVSG